MSGRTHPSYWSAHHPHFPDDSAPAYAVGAEAPTVADYGRNESESICMEVEEAMDVLLKVIQDETALVRSGMLVAAGELDARKKEAARRYVAAVDRVRTAAPMLERMAPHAIDRLKRRNENFRSVLQLNLAALAAARARGRPGMLDADVAPRADLVRLVGLASWAVFSTPGLAAYRDGPPADALAAARAAGVDHAVVTLGEQGLLWLAPGAATPQALPAYALAPVVDTTGAGDVFHGALGVALAEGRAPEAALRFAAAAAALKCLRPGGTRGAPRRAEVEALLAATPAH